MLALTHKKWLLQLIGGMGIVVASVLLLLGQPAHAQDVQLDDQPVIIEESEADESEEQSEEPAEEQEQPAEEQTQPDSDEEAEAVTPASVPETFEYTAIECNNLTQLVRRSIQIFDAETDDIELSPAAIIYAETHVVQELGSFPLDIGDEVSVPRDLVEQYARSSTELSETQLAAWDVYAQNANFELVEIAEPTNVEVEPDNTIIIDESLNELSDESPLTELESQSEQDGASAVWWFVGIGAVLLLWYILWRRPEEPTSSNRKSSK